MAAASDSRPRERRLRHEIVGASKPLIDAYDALRRFARSGARVLIRGETGTGKELFARAYPATSGRSKGPYVPVTIPALSPGLVESELFGHVRGAFTEATRDKKGRLEVAHGGVLFLDEVGDVPPRSDEAAALPRLGRAVSGGGQRTPSHDALVVRRRIDAREGRRDGRFRTDCWRASASRALPPRASAWKDVRF